MEISECRRVVGVFRGGFKEEAVRAVVESSRAKVEVAGELHVHVNTLNKWITDYRAVRGDREESSLTISERAQLRELQRENAELRMKSEFLGKAAAFFAREYR